MLPVTWDREVLRARFVLCMLIMHVCKGAGCGDEGTDERLGGERRVSLGLSASEGWPADRDSAVSVSTRYSPEPDLRTY